MTLAPTDIVWLLLCSGLALLVQAGLLCLGMSRPQRAAWLKPAQMTLAGLLVCQVAFWCLGTGLMRGAGAGGGIGNASLWNSGSVSYLVYQAALATTVVAIFSLPMANRMRPGAFLVCCGVLGGFVYPTVGQWVWGGSLGGPTGWLREIGFGDFAGAGAVQVLAAGVALAGWLYASRQMGSEEEESATLGCDNRSLLSVIGGALVVLGWLGLNGGGSFHFDDSVGLILLNTNLAAAAGGLAAWSFKSFVKSPTTTLVVGGAISGLVAVSALAEVATPLEATIVAFAAGVLSPAAARCFQSLRDPDTAAVVAIHGVCGALGLLARPLMSGSLNASGLGVALSVQLLGIVAIASAASASVYLLLAILGRFAPVACPPAVAGPAEQRLASVGRGLAASLSGSAVSPPSLGTGQHELIRFMHAYLEGIGTQACILDSSGQIVETNSDWTRFVASTGQAEGGRVGDSLLALCHAESVYQDTGSGDLAEAITAVASGDPASFTGDFKTVVNGQVRTFEVCLQSLSSNEYGSVLVQQSDRSDERRASQDVLSEKRKAETLSSALEASQASLELAMKGGELGLWHWDIASGYFELSSNWLKRLGLRTGGLNADIKSFRELLHEDELVFWSSDDAASLAPEEPYDRQFRLRGADGDYRWMQVLGKSNASNPDGSPESLSGILIDIHERKESALRDAGMARIIENSLNEIYVADAETDLFIEVNRGARKNLGYSMEQLRQMTPSDLKTDLTKEQRQEMIRPILSGELDCLEFESLNQRADGSTYPVMLSLQKGRLLDRDVIIGIGIDLTQRRQLEQQLAEAQRLESIGQLAAGIAHEMNTPLQYVGNNMKFLSDCSEALFEVIDAYAEGLDVDASPEMWQERQEKVKKVVERTHFTRIRSEVPLAIKDSFEGVERVLQIVRAMKEFSHPGDHEKHPTDLNHAMTSTITVTGNRWKFAAELDLQLDPDLPHVVCEGCAINQVFVNLVVNAADAITDRQEQDPNAPEGRIVIRSWAEGNHVVFEVEDNGSGMPESIRQRVFEPFYTTKEVGKGTGQGLSLSHTIVSQKHGGSITARSASNEGTTMRVTLPITPEDAPYHGVLISG